MLTKEALAREAATRIGRTVGDKWHVDALLGVGATAAVYAATHKNRSRVAIKWMHASLAASPARVATFLREGYIANGVSHPAVVRVFDDGSEDGAPFLVAELLEGETLADRRAGAAGGVLPLGEVVAACDTLLDALAVAHASGVLHRDIKASNLFRESSGAVRVLDFGLASLALPDEADDDLSLSGDGLVGTPGMMAPEVSSGRRDLIDARSDLWSVGATAFYLLTGRFVHVAKTSQELIARVATQPVKPMRELAPELPARVAAWLDRALSFSRNERFESAEVMRRALGEATSVSEGRVPERSAAPIAAAADLPRAGRGPWPVALAVLVAVAGAFVWLSLRDRPPTSTSSLPSASTSAPHPEDAATPAASLPVAPVTAPSGAASERAPAPPVHGPAIKPVQSARNPASAPTPPSPSAPDPLDRRL